MATVSGHAGETPLLLAAWHGHIELVRFLFLGTCHAAHCSPLQPHQPRLDLPRRHMMLAM